MQEHGTISIHTENIFPIIKKFLYSDHEIFLRELVSNGVDAVQKLSRLSKLGEYQGEFTDGQVKVTFDKEAKTITISDNGIGMTAEEIKKYINQIAFSGASEFLEKYKDTDSKNIIGKFGLGFYSAFMVAGKVEIHTRSYQEGAEPAMWTCDGNTEFEIAPTVKKEVGTDIILHINEDSEEFLDDFRLRGILEKYCSFLPVPVKFKEEQINETEPLWTKAPSDLTDEDYKAFYQKLHPMAPEPLFWIHLNVDYPFELTGVLYFPKVTQDIAENRHKIQLYSRQVFITDDVRDVVPEFLTLLHGVIDSPDIPLNVSRSYLQSDSNVKKITGHITKKVADKLGELFKKDRSAFEEKWDDLDLFVKYGMFSEPKFEEKAKAFALIKNNQGKRFTLEEYKAHISANQTDKDGKVIVLYASDQDKQNAYIASAEDHGYDVALMDGMIDSHWVGHLERSMENTQFKRVDADSLDKLVDKGESKESALTEDQQKEVIELFKNAIGGNEPKVEVQALDPNSFPLTITESEFMRRMKDMSQFGMMSGSLPDDKTYIVNGNHPLVSKLATEKDEGKAGYLVALAKLIHGSLKGKDLTQFAKETLSKL